MLCFVVTWPRKTMHRLHEISGMPPHRIWSYDRLFRARRLPFATCIFTDFDRLSYWELELAAHAYRRLQEAGVRVLNDPARATHRFTLLRRLHAAGLNRFGVWRADETDVIDRWPVFLRTELAHRGPLTDLISCRADLHQALDKCLAEGFPLNDLMIVEYCAQPLRPGLFRKYAAYRIGDRLVSALSVHDSDWVVKYGQPGCADESFYQEELESIGNPPDDPALWRAFELARLEFGRVDYALVDGTPQVYEINSNPTIGRLLEHPFAQRLKAARIVEQRLTEAFREIDSPPGKAIPVTDPLLTRQRRLDILMLRSRWVI